MNILRTRLSLLIALTLIIFASCEKKEQPVVLPPNTGGASFDRVDMGADYLTQVYYDLESGKIVKTTDLNSWDLAMDCSANGYYIFLNGGKNTLIFNTGKTNFAAVNDANTNTSNTATDDSWKVDDPSGFGEQSAIGEWCDKSGNSKGEVYVISGDSTFRKFRLTAVTADHYTIEFGDLNATTPQVLNIPKDDNFNFAFFSFKNPEHIVQIEPAKAYWDVVFTRYRHIYKDQAHYGFKYLVNGVLLNTNKTTGFADSSLGFAKIDQNVIQSRSFVSNRDVIGFDWKTYHFDGQYAGQYTTDPNHCYVIRNRKNQVYKLHFLSYTSFGHNGSPSFEYIRMQ